MGDISNHTLSEIVSIFSQKKKGEGEENLIIRFCLRQQGVKAYKL